MPTVYLTKTNPYRRRFHRTPDCGKLAKRPPIGQRQKVEAIELSELSGELPCLKCYPDAPRAVSAHRYCYVCDPGKTKPCEHNGGVKIYMIWTHHTETFLSERGDQYAVSRWVWPENAARYLTLDQR